ncbi:helix-turn-helix transcriptional regulator [Vagococcus sp. DIV0080]|uniref:Helix-turn-helix transcriptional regulator n=2 Tax=Candidatus Vagococcus giribetii TaxID=2230876 RepID=A0ABS3HPU1_9ENTE|nr:helix-turn-helix transcriptional regulator [Vagococcus sp. DIV0080]
MEIKNMLKQKRIEHKMTQEELSEKLYVSSKTISNWETGKTTPDLDSLIRLKKLFDISLDELLMEGSEVVENIKKRAEIRDIKICLVCVYISGLILSISDFENLFLSVLAIIGIFANGICGLYFLKKYVEVFKEDWNFQSKVGRLFTIGICLLLIVCFLGVIIYKKMN